MIRLHDCNGRWKSGSILMDWPFQKLLFIPCFKMNLKRKSCIETKDYNWMPIKRQMTSGTDAACKQKNHHSLIPSNHLDTLSALPSDTIILFAIFNVNITPNKCPRKQNTSFQLASWQKIQPFLIIFCSVYITFRPFLPHFLNGTFIERCCKMLFDSIS